MAQPSYNFVDGTFFFFKAFGRRPVGALWISLWQILLYAVIAFAALALIAPSFLEIVEVAAQDREPAPEDILPLVGSLFAGQAVAILGSLLAAVLIQAAWLRFLARDEIAAVIPLRFGLDELRLIGVNIILAVLLGFGYFALSFVFALFIGLSTTTIFAVGGESSAGAAVLVGLLIFVLAIAAIGVGIYFMIRFAAAPALTVKTRKFRLFESFAATQGITLWMFLSYVVIGVLFMVILSFVAMIQFAVILAGASELIPTLEALENTEDPRVVLQVLQDQVFQPGILIPLGIVILLQMLAQIFLDGSVHGVGAYAATRDQSALMEDQVETPSESVGDAPTLG